MEYVNRGASSYLPCCTCSVPTSGIARMCPDWAPCVWAPRLAHTHAGDEQKWMYWKSPRLRHPPPPSASAHSSRDIRVPAAPTTRQRFFPSAAQQTKPTWRRALRWGPRGLSEALTFWPQLFSDWPLDTSRPLRGFFFCFFFVARWKRGKLLWPAAAVVYFKPGLKFDIEGCCVVRANGLISMYIDCGVGFTFTNF